MIYASLGILDFCPEPVILAILALVDLSGAGEAARLQPRPETPAVPTCEGTASTRRCDGQRVHTRRGPPAPRQHVPGDLCPLIQDTSEDRKAGRSDGPRRVPGRSRICVSPGSSCELVLLARGMHWPLDLSPRRR